MNARLQRMLLTIAFAGACLCAPLRTYAQAADAETHPLDADFKGMVGLGLIGAELGFVIPALAGARDAWVYIVFPVLGAGGGAVAGYFLLEKGDGEPELAVAALTVGMALAIPALVVTLAATAYEPEAEEPVSSAPRRKVALASASGPGLVRWSERGLLLAPPGIAAGHSVSAKEALRTGVRRERELRVALLSGVF